ncbi:MAG: HEAT repeat domain-containing protein [Myxococcales bacterium]|nr:HEAT repeat domain-containing protein [Myxococcales bacterium]
MKARVSTHFHEVSRLGLFDLFSGGKGSSPLKKLVGRANNKDAQSVDRWKALEQLRDAGTDEAIAGLLRRFSFVYSKSIEDEQEKDWVHDQLVAFGQKALPEVERSLISAESISWQLKVLAHVAEHDQSWAILEKVIAANDNEYVRDPSRKIQLITFLGEEFKDPRAARALPQYLEDMDEGVRFNTVEALLAQEDEEAAREPLLKLLTDEKEESRRVKIRILDGLADAGWNTHGWKGQVEKLCDEIGRGHSIDGKGRIRKATQKG